MLQIYATKEEKEGIAQLKKKCDKNTFACQDHILHTLSDRLYDLYTSIQSSLEIWKSLEEKYNNEQQGTNKFIIFEFSMVDYVLIMDQVHEL